MYNPIELGDIYKIPLAPTPTRIIGLDDKEVFYDSFWEHNNTWGFASYLNRRCIFYRASLKWFQTVAQKVDHIPLSSEEYSVFRPDIPLRFGRNKDLSWHELGSSVNGIESKFSLNILAEALYLVPYGEKGGRKKSVLVRAKGEMGFSESELILHAAEIRNSINSTPSKGIGIYRSGIEKRIPTFYIGEYLDEQGYLITLE